MDPEETMKLIIDAHREKRWSDKARHVTDLREWMAKGGFAPKLHEACAYPSVLACGWGDADWVNFWLDAGADVHE